MQLRSDVDGQNRWPIPAWSLLAAGLIAARSAGAERRQTVAHGVSRGFRAAGTTSPGGAKDHSGSGEYSFAQCVCRPCRGLVRFVRLPLLYDNLPFAVALAPLPTPVQARPVYSAGRGIKSAAIELRRQFCASGDSLNLNLTRNLNPRREFGSKSKIKIEIKTFAKWLKSMPVGMKGEGACTIDATLR